MEVEKGSCNESLFIIGPVNFQSPPPPMSERALLSMKIPGIRPLVLLARVVRSESENGILVE